MIEAQFYCILNSVADFNNAKLLSVGCQIQLYIFFTGEWWPYHFQVTTNFGCLKPVFKDFNPCPVFSVYPLHNGLISDVHRVEKLNFRTIIQIMNQLLINNLMQIYHVLHTGTNIRSYFFHNKYVLQPTSRLTSSH